MHKCMNVTGLAFHLCYYIMIGVSFLVASHSEGNPYRGMGLYIFGILAGAVAAICYLLEAIGARKRCKKTFTTFNLVLSVLTLLLFYYIGLLWAFPPMILWNVYFFGVFLWEIFSFRIYRKTNWFPPEDRTPADVVIRSNEHPLL